MTRMVDPENALSARLPVAGRATDVVSAVIRPGLAEPNHWKKAVWQVVDRGFSGCQQRQVLFPKRQRQYIDSI